MLRASVVSVQESQKINLAKTKIIYCEDDGRKQDHQEVSFDFLGYKLMARTVENRHDKRVFRDFNPASKQRGHKSNSQ